MTYNGLPFPDIDPVAVHIGGFGLRWYSLAYLAGIVLAWFLARRMVRRYPNPVTEIMVDDVIFWATVGLITGGRLGYVLFYNFSYYAENPLQIFALWKGGMSFHGGLIGVITAVCLYARSVKVSFFSLRIFWLALRRSVCFSAGWPILPIRNYTGASRFPFPGPLFFRTADLCRVTPASCTKRDLKGCCCFAFCIFYGRAAYGSESGRDFFQGCLCTVTPLSAVLMKISESRTRR